MKTSYLFPLSNLLVGVLMLAVSVEKVSAQRTIKPKPPAAPVVSIVQARPDLMQLQATYVAGFKIEHQFIAGPGTAGTPTTLDIGPTFLVGGLNSRNAYVVLLQPNTEYTVRVRQIKTSVEFSAWTTFKFKTPATFSSRPSAPLNLRETNRTATTISLQWDAPSTGSFAFSAVTYEYFINGVKTALPRCGFSPYQFCSEADYRTVTFSLPAAGTSLVFGVAARDVNLNLSVSTELTIAN